MTSEVRKTEKNYFEKLMNNDVFRKTMENVRNHKYTKLITIKTRRNYLVSETNYLTTNFF